MLIPKLSLQEVHKKTSIPISYLSLWARNHRVEKFKVKTRPTFTFSPYQIYQIEKDYKASKLEKWNSIDKRLKGSKWVNKHLFFN